MGFTLDYRRWAAAVFKMHLQCMRAGLGKLRVSNIPTSQWYLQLRSASAWRRRAFGFTWLFVVARGYTVLLTFFFFYILLFVLFFSLSLDWLIIVERRREYIYCCSFFVIQMKLTEIFWWENLHFELFFSSLLTKLFNYTFENNI